MALNHRLMDNKVANETRRMMLLAFARSNVSKMVSTDVAYVDGNEELLGESDALLVGRGCICYHEQRI